MSRVSVLFVVVALAIACGSPRKNQGNTYQGGDTDTGCVIDQDCPDPINQYCDAGVCRPRQTLPQTCDSHSDCPGQYCNVLTGDCVECLNEDHCPVGQRCQSNWTCGSSTGCVTDADCGGLRCNVSSGQCVQCLDASDCPPNHVCRDNACFVDENQNPGCADQTDCNPYGLVCNTETGECEACEVTDPLTGADTCPADLVCDPTTGRCSPGSGPGPGDGTCLTPADCGGQACVIGMCMPCFMDELCLDFLNPVPKICDFETGMCIDPECETADQCPAGQGCYNGHCGECWDSSECRVGEVCVEGVCGPCTNSSQCPPGEECNTDQGVCVPPEPGTVEFGELCSGTGDCKSGLTCLDGGICTRTCIGSGAGGDADCPSGYACQSFYDHALDGVTLCNSADQLGSAHPGHPFTQAPGESCESGNECQTGICGTEEPETCKLMCRADSDCGEGDVCWAQNSGDDITGKLICAFSDTTQWEPVGATCYQDADCDTGLCMGTCDDGTTPCDGSWDCEWECIRVCAAACRTSADCGETDRCKPWPSAVGIDWSTFGPKETGWIPACMPKIGDGMTEDGASCSGSTECASDLCVEGMCTSTCAITDDCTDALDNKACQVATEVDDYGAPLHSGAFCL
ncbi:hypothetical protein ACFL6C_04570 [Myxococcota bacterium]